MNDSIERKGEVHYIPYENGSFISESKQMAVPKSEILMPLPANRRFSSFMSLECNILIHIYRVTRLYPVTCERYDG